MAGFGDIYDGVRGDISDVVVSLDDEALAESVPATPGWRVKDVVSHLTGVAESAQAGDFPREFFAAFGATEAVRKLNAWTEHHVVDRAQDGLQAILEEWAKHSATLVPILNGEASMPSDAPPFADRVLVTDVAVHQQDIYGALGIRRGRDEVPVKIGSASFVGMFDARLRDAGIGPLKIDAGEKQWVAGGNGEPVAEVRATRFELFRALSGRRSPEQIRAYEWSGDPQPFIEFFYPYGLREQALEE